MIVGGAVGTLVVVVAGLAAFGHRFLAQPLSSLFQSGGGTSVWQRFEIWKTAFHIALKNPIAGIGPDDFALVYPKYQSAAWVKALGATYLVNGAHDIFMNVLADQGFVGLALFLGDPGCDRSTLCWRLATLPRDRTSRKHRCRRQRARPVAASDARRRERLHHGLPRTGIVQCPAGRAFLYVLVARGFAGRA